MRDGGTLFLVLALYFSVNAALRLALPASLELDEGQQLFLAQWLAVGYDSQPPFYNWLQYGVVQLVGTNLLSLVLLKNALLFSTYLLVGGAAFLTIRNRALAIIAVLGLLTLPQVVFESQRDLTHSVGVLFAASLFVYALFLALERGTFLAYALTGAAIGIGLLAKYNFALLPAAALLAILFEPAFRARLLNWRMLVTIAVAAAIVTPHARWFLDNIDLATGRTLAKLTTDADVDRVDQILQGLFSLAAALVGFCALTILACWLAFGRRFTQSWQASSPWTRLLGRMFLIVIVTLAGMVVFGGASLIKDRWLTPFLFALPLYLSLKLDALNQTIANAPKRFGVIAVLVMIAVPLALFARVPLAQWTGRYVKINVPYGPAIGKILASGAHRPALVIAEDLQLAGNVRLNAPDVPVVAPGYQGFEKGHAFDAAHPLLLVWRTEGDAAVKVPEPVARLLAAEIEAGAVTPEPGDIAVPYHYGRAGDLHHFGYAWIYPPAP